VCSKSLKIALEVHWFLLADLENYDDNEGISRIQAKCQIAATLMGQWLPLIRPQSTPTTPGGKNQVLSKILSSKQQWLSLTSSPPNTSFTCASTACHPHLPAPTTRCHAMTQPPLPPPTTVVAGAAVGNARHASLSLETEPACVASKAAGCLHKP